MKCVLVALAGTALMTAGCNSGSPGKGGGSTAAAASGPTTVGTIAVGKRADLLVVRGDPSRRIADVENVETVFKGGVGFDAPKLFASVKGQVGLH